MRFSNITYCSGITTSMKLQQRCTECDRQKPKVIDSEAIALWIVETPALAIDCEYFKAKKENTK